MCAALALIAGCGGGGSDGGPVDPPPTGSGLLPAAPAIGATLHEDGVALLGLRDGAITSFRGTSGALQYENVVTHTATASGFTERHSNPFNAGDADSTELAVDGGTVSETGLLQVVPGAPTELVTFVDIRSPVRVNDRYVHLDKHYEDSGLDADGDGKNDALDVVAWTQVMGSETLDLHQRRQVTTVRVDDRLMLRVRFSSDDQYSDVIEFRASKWLAMGHGAVKRFSDTPIDANVREVYTEELDNRDAIDTGLGHTAGRQQLAPVGSNIAGQALPVATDVASFDDHAVVLSRWRPEPGMVLSQLDMRGQAVASTLYRFADFFVDSVGETRMARVGQDLRVVLETDSGLKMLGFDGTGQQVTLDAPVVMTAEELTSDLDSHSFAVQGTADSLWVAWLTYPVESDAKLQLRRFDALGRPQTPVLTIRDAVNPGGLSGVRMTMSADHLLLAWSQVNLDGKQWQYAAVSPSGEVLVNRALGVGCAGDFVPQALDSGPAFTCTNGPDAGAVALDESMNPRRGGDGAIQVDGGLPAWWILNQGPFDDLTGMRDSLALTGRQYDLLWPDDTYQTGFTQIGQMPLADGVLQGEQVQLLAKVPSEEFATMRAVPFANHILLVGTDCLCEGGTLRTMVVWKP